jgi:hypothetical protein
MEKETEKPFISESYPETVEKLSENWRRLEVREREAESLKERPRTLPGLLARYYLPVGLGVGLLLVALAIIFGGLAFLIRNAGH